MRLGRFTAVLTLLVAGSGQALVPGPAYAAATRTEILGQSQTQQWFGRFDLPQWQARIVTSSGYMHWRHSDFLIWSDVNGDTDDEGHRVSLTPAMPGDPFQSKPDVGRVIITIGKAPAEVSPPYNTGTYYSNLKALLHTVNAKYPNIGQVLLQPLATSPAGVHCVVGGETVNTEQNLPAINAAINNILDDQDNPVPVARGLTPRVASCAMFSDSTGHLTTAGRDYVAALHEAYYG
jgi:hypothetical protein